jgi:hypothetical protein
MVEQVPSTLAPKRVLLIPVRFGDIVEVAGERFRTGFAFGSAAVPDAIVWHDQKRGVQRVRVPTWGYTRFVCVSVESLQTITVRVGARTLEPLELHRFDARVAQWAHDSEAQVPRTTDSARRELLDALGVQREILFAQLSEAPEPSRSILEGAVGDWLLARWLSSSYLERPLTPPYFASASVTSGGAVRATHVESTGELWHEAWSGDELSLTARAADVLRLSVRVSEAESAHYELWAGDQRVGDHVRRISERSRAAQRWTPPRSRRVVLRGSGPVRIRVLNGRVRVASEAFESRGGLWQSAALRSPGELLTNAQLAVATLPGDTAALVRELLADEQAPSNQTFAVLARRLRTTSHAGLRAVISSVLLPRFVPWNETAAQLEDFWSASESLRLPDALALRHWVMHTLVTTRDVLEVTSTERARLRAAWLGGQAPSEPDRALMHRALVELLLPPDDGARPRTAAALEHRAASQPSDDHWRRLARSSWRRTAPWVSLSPDPGGASEEQWRVPRPITPGGQCAATGPLGTRWTVLTPKPRLLHLPAGLGTHVRIPLRLLPESTEQVSPDATVDVSGTPVSLLALLGASSNVALAPGVHEFRVTRGAGVVARLPHQGESDCASLREPRRWVLLEGTVRFELPAGETSSLVSVVVNPDSIPGIGARLSVQVGATVHNAWVARPGTGAIEVPVPNSATTLAVTSDTPLLLRARIRRHREKSGDGSASARAPEIAARRPTVASEEPVERRLRRVRELTRSLRGASSAADILAIRTERASLLFELGQTSLARLDAQRRAASANSVDASFLDVELAEGELWLPHRPERVIPLGISKHPLLEDDLTADQVRHVTAHLRFGRRAAALASLSAAGAEATNGRGAQAMAVLLERQGESARAATIFERIAGENNDAQSIASAAKNWIRSAANTMEPATTRHAHQLAWQAAEAGARPGPLLGPLSRSIRWQAPSLATLGNGSAHVEVLGQADDRLPLGGRVRAALTDKPDLARWLTGTSSVRVSELRGQVIELQSVCFARRGPREACGLQMQFDDRIVACESRTEQAGSSHHDLGDLAGAGPESCRLTVPDTARLLRLVSDPSVDASGWFSVDTRSPDGGSRILAERDSFAGATDTVPLTMRVKGPTVVRVRMRAVGDQPSALLVKASRTDGSAASQSWEFSAPGRIDAFASLPEPGQPIQEQSTEYLVISDAGLHELRFQPKGPAFLLRPELPVVILPPTTSRRHQVTERKPEASGLVPWRDFVFPSPTEPAATFPLSGGLDVSAVDSDLGDADVEARDQQLETRLSLLGQVHPVGAWASASVFGRLRDGPASQGAELSMSVSAMHGWPGAYARASVVTQNGDGALGVGARALVGVYQRVQLSPLWALLPGAAFTVRRADPLLRGVRGADRDVYSAYSNSHPRSVDFGVIASHRPYFDTLGRHAAVVRLNPGLDSVDRAVVSFDWQWVGGEGLAPWLSWSTSVGVRPRTELRDRGFVRFWSSPAVTFWHWVAGGQRFRVMMRAGGYWDTPSPGRDALAFFGGIGLGYDWVSGQGLRDHAPLDRPHRQRLEEGSSRLQTEPPASDPYAVPPGAEP